MKHYFNPKSHAVTTHWMLTELNAEHEQVFMDVTSGATRSPEYLAVNPTGKIPALVDDGVVVTEAAAICAYLADRFPEQGLAPAVGSPERATYYRYLFFPGTTLEPMFPIRMLRVTEYSIESVGWGDWDRCMNTVESMTPADGGAMKSGFSAADVVFGGTLDFASQFGWLESPSARVTGYIDRLRARPAYQQSHTPPPG